MAVLLENKWGSLTLAKEKLRLGRYANVGHVSNHVLNLGILTLEIASQTNPLPHLNICFGTSHVLEQSVGKVAESAMRDGMALVSLARVWLGPGPGHAFTGP